MYRRLLAGALLVPIFGGCATKRDLQDLQTEVARMQAAQERLLTEIRRQNETILDSLAVQNFRMRGDLSNQMLQIERQLVQIQELTGQGQQRLAELQADLRSREEAQRRAITDAPVLVTGDNPDADELFESAEGALERGSISTARLAFDEFVASFPGHERAPEARLYLASILTQDGSLEQALTEYSQIMELHPNAPEAASALFRAAMIERQRGNIDRARSMLNQLTAAYPSSPEASVARDELRRME